MTGDLKLKISKIKLNFFLIPHHFPVHETESLESP